MKKISLLLLMVFSFNACSVEEEVVPESAISPVQEMNALFENNGCMIERFLYSQSGQIEVRHNRDSVYILIEAFEGATITAANLHLANVSSDFPTVGKGNLQIKNMEFQETFDPAVKNYRFQFPISDFGDSVFIASNSVFSKEGVTEGFWAGDILVKSGNWAYFNYEINEHPYNAGADNSTTITYFQAKAIPSWDEVRKLYTGMLDPGVPEGQNVGTFNPSIWEIIEKFNAEGIGVYSTTYTIGEGDCNDSVILTVNIVEDNI